MLILLTGASGAGKSTFARGLAKSLDDAPVFISTELPYGGALRANESLLRREGFHYIERFRDIGKLEIGGGTAVLDCLCNLTANELFDEDGGLLHNAASVVSNGVLRLETRFSHLIAVTNEVGADGAIYDESTREYVRTLGEINRVLAQKAECVLELCAGVPVALKGGLTI